MQLTYWETIERLESCTPFGRDSVPLVYIRRSGSSSATSTSGGVASGCSTQRWTSSQPSTGSPTDPALHRQLDAFDRRVQRVLHDQPGRARVLEDEADLLGAEHEVDRHHDGAQAGEREVEHGVLPAVVGEQIDAVALGHAARGERARRAVDRVVELGVGPAQVPVDERELARVAQSGAAQQVAEGVAARTGDVIVHGAKIAAPGGVSGRAA